VNVNPHNEITARSPSLPVAYYIACGGNQLPYVPSLPAGPSHNRNYTCPNAHMAEGVCVTAAFSFTFAGGFDPVPTAPGKSSFCED
jgi:hypothetical protein